MMLMTLSHSLAFVHHRAYSNDASDGKKLELHSFGGEEGKADSVVKMWSPKEAAASSLDAEWRRSPVYTYGCDHSAQHHYQVSANIKSNMRRLRRWVTLVGHVEVVGHTVFLSSCASAYW